MQKVYMAVTADRLELPLFVADSAKEMGKFTGKTVGDVYKLVCKHIKTHQGYRIVRVSIDEDNEELI